MVILDTDVVSLSMRRKLPERARDKLLALPRADVGITAVTLGELYFGALRTASAGRWLEAVGVLRRTMACLDFDADSAQHYGELRAHLEGRGRRLDDADLRIAAICRAGNHLLVSGNAKHFERVPGLRYENWIKA